MNFVLTLCLGILIGLLIGIVAGIIGAIAGLRVLHLVKTKKIRIKRVRKTILLTEISISFIPNLKM